MAARKTKGTKDQPWDDSVRGKIKTSMLLKRLENHIVGEADLTPTQLKAIEILIRKTLPDLQAVTINGNVNVNLIQTLLEKVDGRAKSIPGAG